MAYTLQGNNDCIIVSICNLTGCNYSDVMKAACKFGYPIAKVNAEGIANTAIGPMLLEVTGKAYKITKPRRGQDRLTGIGSWHVPGKLSGHATVIMDGTVYDTDGNVYSLEAYRRITRFVLRRVTSLIDLGS